MHIQCIDMAYGTYAMYSITGHYKFFCRHCIIAASGSINYAAMMSRIASRTPDVRAMREQAESEQQLGEVGLHWDMFSSGTDDTLVPA